MPIQVQVKSHYNLDEHAYIFASIVYAFLIVKYFDNEVVRRFINYLPQIIYFSEWKNNLTLQSVLYFFLFFFFLVFIVESWWGSRLEQKELSSFFSYIIFLLHPILLFLFECIVFDSKQFDQGSIDKPDLSIILRYFFMQSLILGNLVIVRSYFSFIEESRTGWRTLTLNSIKEKLKFFVFSVKEKNKDRIIIFSVSITLTALIFFVNIPPKYQFLVVYLAFILLFIATVLLFKRIYSNQNKFNNQNHEKFLKNIAEEHLPFILRDGKDYGFLLLNKKIPRIMRNYIVNKIRDNDIYTPDDSQMDCCFLTSLKDIENFESRINTLVEEVNKNIVDIKPFCLDNHNIAFSYRKYKKTSFHSDYYKEELFATFRKALEQFKT
nr:hypothetical protein [uncultured Desulfobacter sp.]